MDALAYSCWWGHTCRVRGPCRPVPVSLEEGDPLAVLSAVSPEWGAREVGTNSAIAYVLRVAGGAMPVRWEWLRRAGDHVTICGDSPS